MKFSFCTTCMNRTHHLKQTIFTNIKLIKLMNKKYNNIHSFELSLCNYDSKDDLDNFININFENEILNNILIYTKTYNKKYFNVGHAKNIAHKHSTGDILCNIDADNLLTINFCKFIVELFEKNINYITAGEVIYSNDLEYYHNATTGGGFGRICLSRDNFYKLDGYPEILKGYGEEDNNLIYRSLKYLNLIKFIIPYDKLSFIQHNDNERLCGYNLNILDNNYILSENEKNSQIKNKYTNININILKFYDDNNILEINKYNKIEFGSI
jgi:hypothetical protein